MTRGWFRNPLRELFFSGPRWGDWGFWAGAELEDICAEATQTPSRVWRLNLDECVQLVERRYRSFVAVVYFGMALVATWQTLVVMQVVMAHMFMAAAARYAARDRLRLADAQKTD